MSHATVPSSFPGNISFNAQHSPMGAFMSFTCGNFGTRGGFGLQIGQPGNQDLYIGVKDGDRFSAGRLRCLPFFQGAAGNAASAFLVEQAGPAEQNAKPKVDPYDKEQIKRYYGWATDRWVTDDFEFSIYSPFGSILDPATEPATKVKSPLLPAVTAQLTIDNTKGRLTRTAFLAIGFSEPGARQITSGLGASRVGFAHRRSIGFAAELEGGAGKSSGLFGFNRWTVDGGLLERDPHQLGSCPGIGIEVPAGEKRTINFVFGSFLDSIVTTGLEGRYLYTRYFGSLEEVLSEALDCAASLRQRSAVLDAKLLSSDLSADQQFLIAHATRSYYGSTQLLDVGGQPFWVVNEGEYCMMNTLDLSVDQVFWELEHNPWLVRNLLDNLVKHYSYQDQVKVYDRELAATAAAGAKGSHIGTVNDPDRDPSKPPPPADSKQLTRAYKLSDGGISFAHDMGAHNNFSPMGYSSYELPNLTGCFSYMTVEQLCNWVLTAACYTAHEKDVAWLRQSEPILRSSLDSLLNRGGETGFAQFDSSRCEKGQEITTYDSLDHSLAQTRNNVYIAVKCWASYLGLAQMLAQLGNDRDARRAYDGATRVADHVATQAGKDGVLPAVFERENPGFGSRILPAVEGWMYILYFRQLGFSDSKLPIDETSWKPLLEALRKHAVALLTDPERRNIFPDGGIRLSSTSNNSWMSKIAIFMHVAREVFHLDKDEKIKQLFTRADAAHTKWQTEGSSYWACCDQIVSGVAKGSRYYPRIITAALWMK